MQFSMQTKFASNSIRYEVNIATRALIVLILTDSQDIEVGLFQSFILNMQQRQCNIETMISHFFTESVMSVNFIREFKIKSLHFSMQIKFASNNSIEVGLFHLFQSFILNMQQRQCIINMKTVISTESVMSVKFVREIKIHFSIQINFASNNSLDIEVGLFILNMQQGQCVLPSDLINYMQLHSSVHHMISYTGELTENVCIPTEATNETGYSQLVVCVDIKAYLTKKINEIETEEAIQEESFTLSEVRNCNHLSQFMENNVYERIVDHELAMVVNKFQSPIALMECVIDELKIRIFAKIGNEIKKASFSVPLHNTHCRHHPFNTELCGLWQFINDRNNFFNMNYLLVCYTK